MPLRDKLRELVSALRDGDETRLADVAETAADGSDEQLNTFLVSNALWGGSGSIADQAGLGSGGRPLKRKRIEAALVELGQEQLKAGLKNVRTEMWVEAFGTWCQRGI